MDREESIFQRFFGSNRNKNDLVLNGSESSLARLVYGFAIDEIHAIQRDPIDDSNSNISFNEKIEAAAENFEHVVRLFEISNRAKKDFLKSFKEWSTLRKSNVKSLEAIAKEMQTDKFNSDVAKVVGGVVGAVGGVVIGLSLVTPLAAVTLPLAISGGVASALGGGVVVGTTVTEIVLLKKKLEEAKTLVMQEQANFSTMAPWFIHSRELKEAVESLVSYSLFKEMFEDLKYFQDEVKDVTKLTVDKFKKFIQTLKLCTGKMIKSGEMIEKFGDFIAPVVMTFVIVICLLRPHNRMILNCILQVDRVTVGMLSMVGIGADVGQMVTRIAAKSSVTAGTASAVRLAATSTFVAVGIVIDVLNVVLSSIDIHNQPEVEQAKKIKKAAEDLNKEFLFITHVYDELKNLKGIDQAQVIDWKSFTIHHVPVVANQEDIKIAVILHLPKEAWSCIRLQNLSTELNIWLVKVPTNYSERLLQQSHIIIKGESCLVVQ